MFTEITMNTLKVEWDPPLRPNGEILGYLVEYETSKQQESKYTLLIRREYYLAPINIYIEIIVILFISFCRLLKTS